MAHHRLDPLRASASCRRIGLVDLLALAHEPLGLVPSFATSASSSFVGGVRRYSMTSSARRHVAPRDRASRGSCCTSARIDRDLAHRLIFSNRGLPDTRSSRVISARFELVDSVSRGRCRVESGLVDAAGDSRMILGLLLRRLPLFSINEHVLRGRWRHGRGLDVLRRVDHLVLMLLARQT